jgi:hypothetical protein
MDGDWTPIGKGGKANKAKATPTIPTEDLSEVKKGFQLQALEMAKDIQAAHRSEMRQRGGDNVEKTQCGMIFRAGAKDLEYVTAFSGYDHSLQPVIMANRRRANVVKDKICAEENLLAQYPGRKFLFSFAFDQMGLKPACANCKQILASLQIEDLVS